jgi:hypothetical protein
MASEISIGEIGESKFQLWCSQSGLVSNKANNDKKGWDYIVQFSFVNTSKVADKANNEVSALFQVKTTNNIQCSVSIALSNWNNLIKIPIPSFIIYIILDKYNEVHSVYMTHIDEKNIARVLKRMREAKNNKLNKAKLIYKWQESDKIIEPYSESIKARILEIVNYDFNGYCKKKSSLIETIGYSEVISRGKFSIEGKLTDIIDLSIGLKERMPCKELILENGIRFNIPESIEVIKDGEICVSPIGKKINIEYIGNKGVTVEFPGEVYTPFSMFSELPKDLMKARIKSDVAEYIFYGNGKLNASFSISYKSSKIEFLEALKISKLIAIFRDIDNGFKVRFNNESKADIKVTKEIFEGIHPNYQLFYLSHLVLLVARIINSYFINNNFIIDLDNVMLQGREIEEYNDIEENCDRENIKVSFKTDKCIIAGTRIIIPRLIKIYLAGKVFVSCAYYIGIPYEVKADKGQFYYTGIFKTKIVKKYNADKFDEENELEELNEFCSKVENAILYLEKDPIKIL